jgi:hypothetical protein
MDSSGEAAVIVPRSAYVASEYGEFARPDVGYAG